MAFTVGPLGGDFWYFMPAASFTWYVPATRSSNFAFNVSGAFIRPYGDKEIPIFLRERLGGDRSIRGYKFGAIVPVTYRDGKYHAYFDAQGALLGGNKMYYFNIEYVYALAGPLKTALFFDAGLVWDNDSNIKWNRDPGDPYIDASPIGGPSQEVRSVVRSWGAALRGNLLGFLPLRLDYSRPLNRPMVKHYWTLSLGPTF